MRPTVNVLFNISSNDTPCTNPAGDSNFTKLDTGDFISWRDSQQMGGDSLGGVSYPTIIPETGSAESPKLFLMDYSRNEYTQIMMAGTTDGGEGGGDKQYVCAAWFSGATLTVPYLEAYDDDTHLTWESKPLGDGTPANSIFSAIATTDASPGSDEWVGTPLSGVDSRIALASAPISVAGYVYWNMKQVLSDGMLFWDTADWYNIDLVLAIHFTYS